MTTNPDLLLEECLRHIEEHPDEWNQASFTSTSNSTACGTTACLAGHALVLSGEWQIETYPLMSGDHAPRAARFVNAETGAKLPASAQIEIVEEATRLLDLTPVTAHSLFYVVPCRHRGYNSETCSCDNTNEHDLAAPSAFAAFVRKTVAASKDALP